MKPHVFAGNPLDRGDAQRRDQTWLDAQAKHPQSRILPLCQLDILIQAEPSFELGWLSPAALESLQATVPPVFLGLRDGIAHFALDVSDVEAPLDKLQLGEAWQFQEARGAATQLSMEAAGIVAQSRAQVGWHQRHRFCSVCGEPTQQGRGGHVRTCAACKAQHFPRTDPVAIMLISDGDKCLLGQSRGRLSRTGRYSALAGFIDQGESIEEAVRREVKEEAGIEVGEVRYHSSQPWPFPSSLMIGCHGKAASTEIRIDAEEMTDVRWFHRDDVRAALRRDNPNLQVPDSIAIAHHLIRAWAEGEVAWDSGGGTAS
ncbi:NAD(+) diphosphatase [Candidatus Entotheonella serta]|nr:NAD(+) diphosphatase [Candidatus Entotheonella serta]